METKISKSDWIFFIVCLLLGIIAEEAFFRGEIGISYFAFIFAFYAVFFWRYRRFPFSHQRFGYLVLICIWLLSLNYYLHDNIVFNTLNIIAIPALVIFHLLVVTGPKKMKWNQLTFVAYIFFRFLEAIKYNAVFVAFFGKGLMQGGDESKKLIWKKVLFGILISVPVLFVVLNLLMEADSEFKQIVGVIPQLFQTVNVEMVMRIIIILIYTFGFFGLMQSLFHKQIKAIKPEFTIQTFRVDAVIAITMLVIMNIVYLLFTVVQFKYFFSGTLLGGLTYAEYARKGFFELLFVTLINLSITVVVLSLAGQGTRVTKRLTQILLTILILASFVMLISAFLRLSLYEEAYGFSFIRVLSHSFMIFLVVIFIYTLVKIWIEKLSLFHFYFITALIYYTAINIIDLDKIVVKENIDRYEQTGKIDLQYINDLSSTGVLGLIELYQKDQNVPGLKTLLVHRKYETPSQFKSWQSYNLQKEIVKKKLRELNIN